MNKEQIKEILEEWFKDPIDVPCAYCEAAKEIEQQLKHHEANALKEQMERVIQVIDRQINSYKDNNPLWINKVTVLEDIKDNLKAELEGDNG